MKSRKVEKTGLRLAACGSRSFISCRMPHTAHRIPHAVLQSNFFFFGDIYLDGGFFHSLGALLYPFVDMPL